MKSITKLTIFVVPVVLLLSLVAYRVATKGTFEAGSPQARRLQAATNQMALWDEGAEYISIESTESFKAALHDLLRNRTGDPISADQERPLVDSVYGFLMAYNQGDYSVYTHFRMAAPGEISSKHLAILRNFVTKNSKLQPDAIAALSQDKLFREFVEIRSKGTLFKDYFSSVSRKKSQVDVKMLSRIPDELKTFVFNSTTNLGVASFEPMFTFYRSPEQILKQDGVLICATVLLHMRTTELNGHEMPAPVFLRLVWDKESKNWLPSELAVGNIWQKSGVIIAF